MDFNKSDLEKIFSGVPKEKLEAAMKKADTLSKNPEVKNSFSKISDGQIKEMLTALSGNDKQKIISALGNGKNAELSELIKKLKRNL